jgi:catechol 2,3-dioxygenase-like lactoylglutathione lyase family enzyme
MVHDLHRQTSINRRLAPVSRIQLALNVDDLDRAVDFYTRYFGVPPAKRRPGYANFAVATPPLKLVLIENRGRGGTLNHLGVEVFSTAEVDSAAARLAGEGLAARPESGACCYAVQEKVWTHDPDGLPWEVYTVLADAPVGPHAVPAASGAPACCAPAAAEPGAGCCP